MPGCVLSGGWWGGVGAGRVTCGVGFGLVLRARRQGKEGGPGGEESGSRKSKATSVVAANTFEEGLKFLQAIRMPIMGQLETRGWWLRS